MIKSERLLISFVYILSMFGSPVKAEQGAIYACNHSEPAMCQTQQDRCVVSEKTRQKTDLRCGCENQGTTKLASLNLVNLLEGDDFDFKLKNSSLLNFDSISAEQFLSYPIFHPPKII